ncbi:DUF4270 family protein [Spirosoma harenae]
MRTFWYAGLLLLTGMVLFACQSGDLLVGQSVVNPQELVVQSVDSVSIRTSTVMRPDSFITSGDTALLVGRWADAQTGLMTARSFAALNYTSNSLNTQTNQQLDSLVLELNYAYVYGDTTSAFDISVHKLARELPYVAYYNTSSFPYDSRPLFRKTVIPQPNTRTRKISFRLTNAEAQAFFQQLSSSQITDASTLSSYIPGYAINCNASGNTFVGISTARSGLRLYYHSTDVDRTASTLLFPFTSAYFTQLLNDRTGTPLSALKNRSDAVSSRLTNNTSFIVPGAQLMTRLEFPYLNQFDRPERFADLNKALLIISPVRRTLNDNATPPTTVALYFTNNQNELLNNTVPVGIGGTSQPTATYTYDPLTLMLTDTYAFDLTYYVGQVIKRKQLTQPLLLGAYTVNYTLRQWVGRATIGNQQRLDDQLQLKLFMTSGL